jgi:DNA-binding transcriptional LysR family regulator
MDDLRSLRQFVEIARQGSFTAAAARLGLTTAALSKSIGGLEKRFGMRLLVRTTRSLHLSDAGRVLFERLAPSFETIEATVDQVGASSHEPVGAVRLSTVTAFGKCCVLPLLPEFFARHPGIMLTISFHDGGRGLTRQAFDVRINWGEQREQDKVAQLLCTMPLILVASPAYIARHGVPRTPADMVNHECISVMLANGTRARWTFVKRGAGKRGKRFELTPKGRLVVMDELDAVIDAAQLGLGITVSSAENVMHALHDGSLVRLLPDYDIPGNDPIQAEIIIQYSARKYLPLKVKVLVDFLLERLRNLNLLEIVGS